MEIITTMDVSKRMDKLNCYALGFLRARYYVRGIADTPPTCRALTRYTGRQDLHG